MKKFLILLVLFLSTSFAWGSDAEITPDYVKEYRAQELLRAVHEYKFSCVVKKKTSSFHKAFCKEVASDVRIRCQKVDFDYIASRHGEEYSRVFKQYCNMVDL